MVQFVVSPKDDLVLDFKITSIIKTALWLILIHVSITVVYHFADLMFFQKVQKRVLAIPYRPCRCG